MGDFDNLEAERTKALLHHSHSLARDEFPLVSLSSGS